MPSSCIQITIYPWKYTLMPVLTRWMLSSFRTSTQLPIGVKNCWMQINSTIQRQWWRNFLLLSMLSRNCVSYSWVLPWPSSPITKTWHFAAQGFCVQYIDSKQNMVFSWLPCFVPSAEGKECKTKPTCGETIHLRSWLALRRTWIWNLARACSSDVVRSSWRICVHS